MPAQPNVILILVDDMGFADLGVMGSEIRTPNIDRLARDGVLLTSMYNCARCCPARIYLLFTIDCVSRRTRASLAASAWI